MTHTVTTTKTLTLEYDEHDRVIREVTETVEKYEPLPDEPSQTAVDCGSCQERDADLSINYELRPGLGTVRNLCTGCVPDFLLSLASQAPHGITVDLPHREDS